MPTFMRLIEPSKNHYQVKLHESVTGSFQVMSNFLTQKYENSSQGQTSRSNVIKIF